jgi:D-aminopeptidase
MSTTFQFDTARIDAVLSPHDRSDRPGLAVGVAHRGRPLLRRGLGLASVELPVVLTPSTRLRVASVTKQFCALAVMLLAEDGKLSIDDSIRHHLPDLPPWAAPITLAQLMGHTSGMRCSIDLLFFLHGTAGRAVGANVQREMLRGLGSVNFAPGSDFVYCNGGYTLLTELVERLADQPFGDFLRERVLQPVGMHDSLLRADDELCLPNTATQHRAIAGGGFARGHFGPPHDGAGGLVSTVDDMLRWMDHLRHPRVGTAATWAAMRTPLQLRDGASTGYGLGLMSGVHRGLRVLHHSGLVFGGTSQMIQVPDHELDIIVLANHGGIDSIGVAEQIIDACITGLPPAPLAARLDVEGEFLDAERGRLVRLLSVDGTTQLEINGARLPLEAPRRRHAVVPRQPEPGRDLRARRRRVGIGLARTRPPLAPAPAAERPPAQRHSRPRAATACRTWAWSSTSPTTTAPRGSTCTAPTARCTTRCKARGAGVWACTHDEPRLAAGAVLMQQGSRLTFTTLRTRHLILEPDPPMPEPLSPQAAALLEPWAGPFGGLPPLTPTDPLAIEQALRAAIDLKRAEVQAIAQNPAPPTFENTAEALEDCGRALNRVITVFRVHANSLSLGEMPAVAQRIAPLLAALDDEIAHDERLFARLGEVWSGARAGRPVARAATAGRRATHPHATQGRGPRAAGQGAAGADQRAAGVAVGAVQPEPDPGGRHASRLHRRRSRPRRPARRAAPGGGRGRPGARPPWRLGHRQRARRGLAGADAGHAARSARTGVAHVDEPRRPPRPARQPTHRRRDAAAARRTGAADGPPPATRTWHWPTAWHARPRPRWRCWSAPGSACARPRWHSSPTTRRSRTSALTRTPAAPAEPPARPLGPPVLCREAAPRTLRPGR